LPYERTVVSTDVLPARSRLGLYLDLIRWDRPAGWLLLLWPTLGALWIAAGGWPGWHLLAVFVLGTFLMRSAGCAVNDVADRDFDRHVKRTSQRPVTRGALAPREAAGGRGRRGGRPPRAWAGRLKFPSVLPRRRRHRPAGDGPSLGDPPAR
jgi:hypothetical protein